jgi:ankyrin repeat protein
MIKKACFFKKTSRHWPLMATGMVSLLAPLPVDARGDTPLNVPENWFKPLTVEMIQAQLDAGVDLNQLNRTGSSVIVRAGNTMAGEEVWQFLINRGARLTEKQLEGREAIFWVAKGGAPEAVRLVLAQPGVDVNTLDKSHRNAFAHAVRLQPDVEVYRELIRAGVDIHRRDVTGRTAMHEAAMRTRYVHLFEFFHSLGLSYDDLDHNGWNPFLNAAWRNPIFDVVVHLAQFSEIDQVGHDGLNAAMLAAENNPNGKVFRWLLDQGLSVDGRDEHGATALIRAGRNSAEVASQLLAMGQDVNAVDHHGNTPFIMAGYAQVHAPDLFRLFADSGADVQAVNHNGANALMVALENGWLYKRGPQNIRLLMQEYGLRPTPPLADGSTALTIAAEANQSAEILRLPVAAGADVNAADANGMTPLMIYAADTYNTGAIDYLIATGADLKQTNASGQTAADLARANEFLGCGSILKRLSSSP